MLPLSDITEQDNEIYSVIKEENSSDIIINDDEEESTEAFTEEHTYEASTFEEITTEFVSENITEAETLIVSYG